MLQMATIKVQSMCAENVAHLERKSVAYYYRDLRHDSHFKRHT